MLEELIAERTTQNKVSGTQLSTPSYSDEELEEELLGLRSNSAPTTVTNTVADSNSADGFR